MDSIIIFCAKYLFVAVVLIIAWVWLKSSRPKKLELAVAAISAGIIALAISRLAAKLYYDPRPFVTHNVKPLIPHAADNGFPSDHALLTMTLTSIIYFYDRRWALIALIATLVVGIARVAAHIHSPIDIIGSLVIGVVAGFIGVKIAQRFTGKEESPKTA